MGVLFPLMSTTAQLETPDISAVLSQIFPPRFVQSARVENPDITGLLPVPYAPRTILAVELPDLFTMIVPGKTSPLLKRILSPGFSVLKIELSFVIVFQGVEGLLAWLAVRESSPADEEK